MIIFSDSKNPAVLRVRTSLAGTRVRFPMSLLLLLLFAVTACHVEEPYVGPHGNDSIPTPDTTILPVDTIPSDTVVVPPVDTTKTETPDQKRNPAYLYDLTALPQITLTLTEKDWNQYLSNFDANPHNGLYVPAKWTMVKGQDVWHRDSVGLRPRGNTSRVRPEGGGGQPHTNGGQFHHAHFGVRFTEYVTGERFFGSDRVILKWFRNEPAYCREVYCYDLFRRFGVWTAPRASYCRLWLQIEGDDKPVYMGVYELIEGVRNGYLDDRRKDGYLPDSDGNLWKAAWGADLSDFNITGTSNMGVSDEEHSYVYSLKTNKKKGLTAAQKELYDFMEQMRPLPSGSEQLHAYLEQHADVDLFLRMMAVNVAVGMWDDYWINKNNYYFYFDSNHKFYFIPFDYDNTLGTSQAPLMDDAGTANPLTWGSLDGDRLLCKKIFSITEYKELYKQYLLQLCDDDELFTASGSATRIRQWHNLISAYVANDTGEDMQIEDLPASWGSTPQYRLLSTGNNFFNTRKSAIYQYCK